MEKVWEGIQNAIRETVLAETWEEDDWKANPEEERILMKLNMNYGMMYPKKRKKATNPEPEPRSVQVSKIAVH